MRFLLNSSAGLGYHTRGQGPVVVLLHPVGLDRRFWDDVVGFLAPTCRVIAVDLRGHGDSDVPAGSFSLDDLAADVAELIEAIGQPPAVIVGCSLGGMVAQGVALAAPHLVAGLVLANTSHDRDSASRAALHGRANQVLAGMPTATPTSIARWFNDAYRADHPQRVQRLETCLLAADPIVHARSWRAIADLAYGDRLAGIAAPTLVVTGSDDRSVPMTAALAMAAAIPGAQHTDFAGAGHLTPYERPAEFAALVAAFVAALPGGSQTTQSEEVH
jgi:3-oxoadipate enol-lactonase